jgi:hypothetical protein
MKKRFWAGLLVAVLLLFSGCKAKPAGNADSIVGTWKDSYGLTEYKFEDGGKMKIEALNLGSFSGTYQIDGDQISIQYRVALSKVQDSYTMKLDGNTLYLNDQVFTRKK